MSDDTSLTNLPDALIGQLSQEIGRLVAEVTTLRLLLEKVVAERDALIQASAAWPASTAISDGPADSPVA